METITRTTLKAAIEQGIEAAREHPNFTLEDGLLLRQVGANAETVGGCYSEGCPVAQAYPADWPYLSWSELFTKAFDAAFLWTRSREVIDA